VYQSTNQQKVMLSYVLVTGQGFGLIIGFTGLLQLVSTSTNNNYAPANLRTRLLTTAHIKSSQSVFTSRR
jgi:hypothetical protein